MPDSRHFADLIAEQAAARPDALAVVSVTYAQLDAAIRSTAGALAGLGVEAGDTVGLLCTNRWEWLAAAFGTMRLGARVAASNTWAKAWDLEYMLSHSGVEVLVLVDQFRGRSYVDAVTELRPSLPRLREVVLVGDLLTGGGDTPSAAAPDHDAYVLYTSGSSARPKAVPLRHRAAIENGFAIGERMELTPEDRVLLPTPLFWSYGAVNAVPAAFTNGATLVLQEAFEAAGALELIERHRCTAIYTLPNITAALTGHATFTPERTRTLRTGLTIGRPEDVRRAAEVLGAERICNIYGSTETYGNCCVTPAAAPLETRLVSQGPPLPGVELRIVDPVTREPRPVGEVGEIEVRGYTTRGYLRDDGLTLDIVATKDGFYRTGDLASVDGDGWLHYAARATDMIKTGGINVAPAEVEELLGMHPDIGDVAVVGGPDEQLGEAVIAFVVAAPGALPDSDAIRAWCRDRVAAFKVPRELVVLDELPKTDTGKLSRRALREQAERAAEGVR